MGEYLVLKCDECGEEVKQFTAVGWYRLERAGGIDTTTFSDPILPAYFCGHECLCEYMHKRDQK